MTIPLDSTTSSSAPTAALHHKWRACMGRLQQQWGFLTLEEVEAIGGNRERLIRRVQQHSGRPRAEVEREINRWEMEYAL